MIIIKFAGIIKNDVAAAPGLCLSFYTQGCPNHCPGCHNPETWDFKGGKEFSPKILEELKKDLNANNIHRNFCVLGGEPLCPENQFLVRLVIEEIKEFSPETKIYIWTGYKYEDLINEANGHLKAILDEADYLIDGPYVAALRDITLEMRGSTNQRIIDLTNKKK